MGRKTSSGILIYKFIGKELQFFLVHPGGPIFKNKEDGHWGIPKGEVKDGEDYLSCAIREVEEEIGLKLVDNEFIHLGFITQKGGKVVHAWACEHKDEFTINTSGSMVEMIWPPVCGKKVTFPEIDRGGFFNADEAVIKIKSAQFELIERLKKKLDIQ